MTAPSPSSTTTNPTTPSAGRRVVPTPDDLRLFTYLDRRRVLRTNHLFTLCPTTTFNWNKRPQRSYRWFQQRLKSLEEAGYLGRIKEHYSGPKRYALWHLKDRGANAIGKKRAKRPPAESILEHELALAEFMTTQELALRPYPHLRLIERDEIIAASPVARQSRYPMALKYDVVFEGVPVRGMTFDELYGIHHTLLDEAKYFLVERDRGSETERYAVIHEGQTDIFKKILQLDAAFKDFKTKKRAGQLEAFKYRVPNWRALFITTGAKRLENMRNTSQEATGGMGRRIFMFADRDAITPETLLRYDWESMQNGELITQRLVPEEWLASS